jgi:cyanate lyase
LQELALLRRIGSTQQSAARHRPKSCGRRRAWRAAAWELLAGLRYFAPVTKSEASEAVQQAMRAKGLTFAEVAAELGRPRVWLAAAVLGQHPFPRDAAEKLAEVLGLPEDVVVALQQIPTRGGLDAAVPVDPTIYRLYEVIQVYGPALKALLHEEFGDGIMSAINFRADIERVPDPAGDRVRITFDGKFLPYQWD